MNPQQISIIEPASPTTLSRETLTSSQWATLLDITRRGFRLRRVEHSEMKLIRGTLTKVYAFADLPQEYQETLEARREKEVVQSFADLLDIRRVEHRHVPAKAFAAFPEATRERAEKKKCVMSVYFSALDAGRSKREANQIARAEWLKFFDAECSEKTIRRLEAKIESAGGMDWAPLQVYCDGKSCPHIAARREVKLNIPPELITAFKAQTTQTEHISAAFRRFEMDWLAGREVPGLGKRTGNERFPFKCHQLRPFAASTPARRWGSHGKARARREALPTVRMTSGNLMRSQLYMLDDTRIDIIATDDRTGQLVELKSYWIIDVGPRRIEGFVLKEAGAITAADVETLVARTLRGSGIAAPGANYLTTIKFERGTVACSPARQSFLESVFPGQLQIDRTSIDGGKSFRGDFAQSSSGHWMGKGRIESFMRTVAFFLENMPGQRGGDFRRQPANLGLIGKNSKTGALDYHTNSRMHDAALLGQAEKGLEWIETGEVVNAQPIRRLKIASLKPVSWVMSALNEFAAYFNQRTDHRMEGFDRIEYQCPETRSLKWRMESPNERASRLHSLSPTVRISAADAAFMLEHTAKNVTVGKNGVTFDLSPLSGLNFWHENSIAVNDALRLATRQARHVALFDAEAIRLWTPAAAWIPEIHLLSGKPGEPGCRYLETLPLRTCADMADADSDFAELEKTKRAEKRYAAEVARATAPIVAERLAAAKENVSRLRGTITTMREMPETAKPSGLLADVRDGRRAAHAANGETTRLQQQLECRDAYAASLPIDEENDG